MSGEPLIQHPPLPPEYFFKEGCHIVEWWNRPEDESLSLAKVRVDPGKVTRLHRLAGTAERYFILEGQGEVEINHQDPVPVSSGAVIFIPPDTDQRIRNTGTGPLLFLVACTPRFQEKAYRETGEDKLSS